MIYEMLTYEAIPGKMKALVERYGIHHLEMYKRHGVGFVGSWTDDVGTTNRFTAMLSYESMADREQKRAMISKDSSWKQELQEGRDEVGIVVERTHNSILVLTPYSPEPSISARTNLQELRIYEAMPGKLPAVNDRFANYTYALQQKHKMDVVAYWTADVGTDNQLIYMLGYPSMGDRERSFASFAADPVWHKALAESERDGPLLKRVNSSFLRPTAYTPRK